MKDRLHGPPKILVAWPDLLPVNHAGAVRGASLIRAAIDLGWEPIPVTPRIPGTPDAWPTLPAVTKFALYDSYASKFPLPVPFSLLAVTIFRITRFARRKKIRAVISSTPGLFLGLEALLASRVLGVPFFFDVRDAWKLEEATHKEVFRNRIKNRLEGVICRGATEVWVVTESLGDLVRRTHVLAPQKIRLVPNGAALEEFAGRSSQKTLDFVFLGAPSAYRDLPRLLEAIVRTHTLRPSLKVLWLGWRSPQLAERTETLLDKLSRNGVVEKAAPVAHEQVADVISKAKSGIVSLSGEDVFRTAIGAKTYEYLAAGLPIACLGPPGSSELRRLVEANAVGFYASNPEEFATSAANLLSDAERRNQQSTNARELARRYDRSAIAHKVLEEAVAPRIAARVGSSFNGLGG